MHWRTNLTIANRPQSHQKEKKRKEKKHVPVLVQ
jgi:hypothetical protein